MALITTLPQGKAQNHLAFIAHTWLPNLHDRLMKSKVQKVENLSFLNKNICLQRHTQVDVSYKQDYTIYEYKEHKNLLKVCRVYSAFYFNSLVNQFAEAFLKRQNPEITDTEIDALVDENLGEFQERFAEAVRKEMIAKDTAFYGSKTHWQALYLIDKNANMCEAHLAFKVLYKFAIIEVCKVC